MIVVIISIQSYTETIVMILEDYYIHIMGKCVPTIRLMFMSNPRQNKIKNNVLYNNIQI